VPGKQKLMSTLTLKNNQKVEHDRKSTYRPMPSSAAGNSGDVGAFFRTRKYVTNIASTICECCIQGQHDELDNIYKKELTTTYKHRDTQGHTHTKRFRSTGSTSALPSANSFSNSARSARSCTPWHTEYKHIRRMRIRKNQGPAPRLYIYMNT